MQKFVKKPRVIEAILYDGSINCCGKILDMAAGSKTPAFMDADDLIISTLEGHMKVSVGDWVIRGVAGEHYPCKPDIFAESYDAVAESDSVGREITSHKVNPANDLLKILAVDEPGSGGANHRYNVVVPGAAGRIEIDFQNGPIAEAGVNGLTHEALIAIVIDRLQAFQTGPFACRENALALTKLEEAMHWLHHRTRARMQRGVEGTHKV
jgi:hypothetical protein